MVISAARRVEGHVVPVRLVALDDDGGLEPVELRAGGQRQQRQQQPGEEEEGNQEEEGNSASPEEKDI